MIKLAGALSPMLNFVESQFDGMSMEGSLALIISACLPVPCSVSETAEIPEAARRVIQRALIPLA
jgi:hypothetical protein